VFYGCCHSGPEAGETIQSKRKDVNLKDGEMAIARKDWVARSGIDMATC
jgi:hypothetical protein